MNSKTDELKDITFDMDDVFDEWKTEIEKDGESHETDQRDLFVTKIKVRFSVLCRCFNSSPPGRQLRRRLDIAHKIERLDGRL